MTPYGWFRYEPRPDRIALEATGQRVAIFPAGPPDAFDVVYTDGEFECQLRLDIVREQYRLPAHTLKYPAQFADAANYGRWRRLDEFVVDALLCWQMVANTSTGSGLLTIGAWRSGVWEPDLRRRTFGAKAVAEARPDNPTWPLAQPVLLPLDLPVPPRWRVIEGDAVPRTRARMAFERFGAAGVPLLPRGRPVSGFEGMPCLARDDGAAFIFFAELEPQTYRDNEPETHLHYTYVDDDFFFTFKSAPRWRLSLGICSDYGYREVPPPRELWPVDSLGKVYPWDQPPRVACLGHAAWLRMKTVLHDAWPAWGTTPRRVAIAPSEPVPADHGREGFIGNYGPGISTGYTAGLMNGTYEVAYL